MLLLTRMDLATEPIDFERLADEKQIFESCHQPTRLYQLRNGEACALDLLKGQRILAVCGIGNPEAFAGTLRQFEPKAVELLAFPDHHRYSPADISEIRARAHEVGADIVVTTEKDSQKLQTLVATTPSQAKIVRFFVLEIELRILTNIEALKERLQQVAAEPKSELQ